MHVLSSWQSYGVRIAAVSDKSDGDCSTQGGSVARRRFANACGFRLEELVVPRQVHGTTVAVITHNPTADRQHDSSLSQIVADALVTREPGIVLGITVADCVPVFFVVPTVPCIALAHAGRQGIRNGIVPRVVETIVNTYGTTPRDVRAYIGPCARVCCYEVSEEIHADWVAQDFPARGRYLDLPGAVQHQLSRLGVPAGCIETMEHCTICGDRFYSYRASNTTARNLAVLGL